MGLGLTDSVLGGVLLLSMVVGAWRGLIDELMSLAGWVAAFVMARWLAEDLAEWLPFWREAATPVRHALSFVGVFVASVFAAGLLSRLLRTLVVTAGLRSADRSLGAVFGLTRGVVVLLVLAVVVGLLGMHHEPWWLQSNLTPVLQVLLSGLKPLLPQAWQAFLP